MKALIHDGKPIIKRTRLLLSPWSQAIGLMGRKSAEKTAYIFVFRGPRSDWIHMFFMRFSIDIVWLDECRRVIGIHQDARPWQKPIRVNGASYLIEMEAGNIERHGIKINDRLDW